MNDVTRRVLFAALLAAIALPLLAACGKKGKLEPPTDEPLDYPRRYPDPSK